MLTSKNVPTTAQGRKPLRTLLYSLAFAFAIAFVPNNTSFAQCAMSCHEVNFSLADAPFCSGVMTPAAILSSSSCDGNDTIFVQTLNDVTIPTSPQITSAYIGQRLKGKVMNRTTGQSCWSFINVEYKFPPKITPGTCVDVTLNCYESTPPATLFRPTVVSCNLNTVLTATDNLINVPCGDATYPNFIRIVERKWVVVDNNSSAGPMKDSCTQRFFFTRVNPNSPTAGIVFPNTYLLDCGTPFTADANGNPTPSVSGAPTAGGLSIYTTGTATPNSISSLCILQATYSDQSIALCGNTRKIIRNWKVFNGCSATYKDTIQFIEIRDITPPRLTCPVSVTVNQTDPLIQLTSGCKVNLIPPKPAITDACSNAWTTTLTTNIGRIVFGDILADVPIDTTATVTFTVTDQCGNSATCTWQVTVRDNVAPTPVCRQTTKVSLSVDGIATISAATFDAGSYDNCSIRAFKVRRLGSPVQGTSAYGNSVTFQCADIAFQPVMVELLVCDKAGNSNSCMVEVLVEDKIPPTLSCPGNITVNCNADRSDLNKFGKIVLAPPYKRDTFYINAQGVRSITNNGGTQIIDGLGRDNCNLMFSTTADSSLSSCGFGFINRNFRIVDLGGNALTCTQRINIVDPSPFSVSNITWPSNFGITNCTYPDSSTRPVINTFGKCSAQIMINNEDIVFLTGSNGGAGNSPSCLKVLRKWRVIDWCQYVPNSPTNAGYFEYTQEIRVFDNTPPVFTNFPSSFFSDITNGTGCTAVVNLPSATATDCNPNIVPTVSINFPAGVSGSGYGPYSNVPSGFYIATYRAEDGCGNVTTRTLSVTVREKKKPTPICINGLSVDLMPTLGMVSVPAVNFNAGSYDNCTPSSALQYRIGRAQGPNVTAVPTETSLVFTCADLSAPVQVDMWVGDAFGNWDYCTTYIVVQNNMGANCPPSGGTASIAGAIRTEVGTNVEKVNVNLTGATVIPVLTGATGAFQFGSLPSGGNVSVVPQKNLDPLNGVSTFDIVKINRHILGSELLNSPYKMIAADVNRSGRITTLDIVDLRQLILQRIPNFNNNTSWRFVEKKYVFSDPSNPFADAFPEICAMNPLSGSMPNVDFVAIKVGDVNGDAQANSLTGGSTEEHSGETLVFNVKDQDLKAGNTYEVAFHAEDLAKIQGYQFTLNFDKNAVQFIDAKSDEIKDLNISNFGLLNLNEGTITTSWNGNAANVEKDAATFKVSFKAKSDTQLSKILSVSSSQLAAEAYDKNDQKMDVALQFNGKATSTAAKFELYQNQPNPVSKATTIGFTLPSSAAATLTIFDISGRVLNLMQIDGVKGYNEVSISREDLKASGVAYYRLETNSATATKKMVILE